MKNDIVNNEVLIIYTAIFDNYDQLIDPKSLYKNCKFICFTNNKDLKSKIWEIIFIETNEDPIILNRKYKFLPNNYFNNYKFSMYVDGNIEILSNPYEIMQKYITNSIVAAPLHLERQCIYQEAYFCIDNNISDTNLIRKQVLFLKENKYPANYGFNEMNIIIRKHNNPLIINAMNDLWSLFMKYPTRDQLIFNYIFWKHRIKVSNIIENSHIKNKYFFCHPHYAKNKSLLRKVFNLFWYRRHHNPFLFFLGNILFRIHKLFKIKLYDKKKL